MDSNLGSTSRDMSQEDLLKDSRLFDDDEIRNIVQMRKQYDTKIRKKEKQTYFNYIEREKEILYKLKENNQEDGELYHQIEARIIRIYKLALMNFKEDVRVWLQYIRFCTECGKVEFVTESFPLMLEMHKERRLWHLAAKWELTQFNNVDKALIFLYRGLHYNLTADCLYKQILRLELSSADTPKLGSHDDINDKQATAVGKAINLFEIATKNVKEYGLYIDLLKIASEFKFTDKLQIEMYEYLVSTYSEEENVWHVLAQRELEGLHLENSKVEQVASNHERCMNCVAKYEEALVKVPTRVMSELYLDNLLDLYQRFHSNEHIKNKFIERCEKAHRENYLTEKQYLVWTDCLKKSPEVGKILQEATKNNPTYIQLWLRRVRYHYLQKEDHLIQDIFAEAIVALGDEALPMWKRRIQYYQFNPPDKEYVDQLFMEALHGPQKVSQALQPYFLEWTALFRSRDVLHARFKHLSKLQPVCFEMCQKMAELEAMVAKPSEEIFEIINMIMSENPCLQSHWKEYVCHEMHCGPAWRRVVYSQYLSPDR